MRERVLAKLEELAPAWVGGSEDWGAGVRFTCPTHRNHRISLHFGNPIGGYPAERGLTRALYMRVGASFHTLTLVSEVDLGECFRGWLVDGEFLVAAEGH